MPELASTRPTEQQSHRGGGGPPPLPGSSRRLGGRLLPDHQPSLEAVRMDGRALTYEQLAAGAEPVATAVSGATRVALWAIPEVSTVVGLVGALTAGVAAVPLNPAAGERELAHVVADSQPELVIAATGISLPDILAGIPRFDVDIEAIGRHTPAAWPEPSADTPALVVYTSGTTGAPKGVVLPRQAIAADLDALATAWRWDADDILTHALPLYHIHGLVLGVLGPLRRGGSLRHPGRFTPAALAGELAGGATMAFGVPTMYHRLAGAAEADGAMAQALRQARLLVSGSAPLAVPDRRRIAAICGRQVIERYGMTETLITCAVRDGDSGGDGTVGPPLDGIDLRLVDDEGRPLREPVPDMVGDIELRGATLFIGYLGRPEATAEATTADGWFRTGDAATIDPEGRVRIVGRRSSDVIKCGGYKIGTGEIENVLLELPGVAEVAVTGEPDDDLGERVVAWIVPDSSGPPTADACAEHVARQLTPYKRPTVVHVIDALPRNGMGKVLKHELTAQDVKTAKHRAPGGRGASPG